MKPRKLIPYPKHYVKKVKRQKKKDGTVREYSYYRCCFQNPDTGKTEWVTSKRKVDCQRKAEARVDELNAGIRREQDSTLGTQKEQYLQVNKDIWSDKEYKNQVSYLRHLDSLSAREVSSVFPEDLQAVFVQIAAGNGMRDSRPPSRTTLLKIKTAVSRFWDYLLNKDMVRRNIVSSVVIPRDWGTPAKTRVPLTDVQIQWVRDTPDPCQTLAMVMLYAGLRTSEACALRGKDVRLNRELFDDPDSNYISVNHSMNLTTGEWSDQTKTPAGVRRIPLCRILYDFLCTRSFVSEDAWFCFPEEHRAMTADRLRVLWRRYQMNLDRMYGNPERKYVRTEQASIDTFTTYQCRHTFCTLCYEAGLDVPSTAYLMGHSDIRMTQQVYTHLREKQKHQELDKLKTLGTG